MPPLIDVHGVYSLVPADRMQLSHESRPQSDQRRLGVHFGDGIRQYPSSRVRRAIPKYDGRSLYRGISLSNGHDLARVGLKENARYLLQPYHVAVNVHRFKEPAGTLTEVAP